MNYRHWRKYSIVTQSCPRTVPSLLYHGLLILSSICLDYYFVDCRSYRPLPIRDHSRASWLRQMESYLMYSPQMYLQQWYGIVISWEAVFLRYTIFH